MANQNHPKVHFSWCIADIQKNSRTVVLTTRGVSFVTYLWGSFTDNIQVLLEAPHRENHLKDSVLLTVDLTKGVADEAIRRKDSIIITYRKYIWCLLERR